jgi:transcriptional regulator with XRE-family HTH domain
MDLDRDNQKSCYFKSEIEKRNISQKQLQEDLGVSQQYVNALVNCKKNIGKRMAKKLADLYDLNESKLLIGEIDDIDEENINYNSRDKTGNYGIKPKTYTNSLAVKVVTIPARAGYVDSYYSETFLSDLPTVLIEADKEYKGNYLAFEVDGDSMEPDYYKGDIVICREVKRDLWQYKLHYKDYDFVIAHGSKGITLKEITNHNVETGDITCHSVNQENGANPDFVWNLKEVAFLYNVVEHRTPGKTKRRNR